MQYAPHGISTSINVNDKLHRDSEREVSSRRKDEEKEALENDGRDEKTVRLCGYTCTPTVKPREGRRGDQQRQWKMQAGKLTPLGGKEVQPSSA